MEIGTLFRSWLAHFFPTGKALRLRYQAFLRLLEYDSAAHEALAVLEEIHYGGRRVDWRLLEDRCERLTAAVSGLVQELAVMAPRLARRVVARQREIDAAIRTHWPVPQRCALPPYVIPLAEVAPARAPLLGGKALHLVQLRRELGMPVPDGFVITTNAFHRFIGPELQALIDARLRELDISDGEGLAATAAELTALIEAAPVPAEIIAAITAAASSFEQPARFAMRSSAACEDSEFSFAGQYRTVLNLAANELLAGYRQVVASRYGARALFYRIEQGLPDCATPMAVLALAMVDAEMSGVMTTIDPCTPAADVVMIHAVRGAGEALVGGAATPEVVVCRGDRLERPSRQESAGQPILPVPVAWQLAEWGKRIEGFYGAPQDIEWCLDRQDRLFLLQARPLSLGDAPADEAKSPAAIDLPVVLRGGDRAVAGVGCGPVCKLAAGSYPRKLPDSTVLVASTVSPDQVPLLPNLAAVVVEHGSTAAHFALVAREFGVPMLVNVPGAMASFHEGQEITVDGGQAVIHAGLLSELPVRRPSRRDTAMEQRLGEMFALIAPLNLCDPGGPDFIPEKCRTMHDLIRYCHEQAMTAMFRVGAGGRIRGARRLRTAVPLQVHVLDLDQPTAVAGQELDGEEVRSAPFHALWRGLSHPGIQWGERPHFDWRSYETAVMGGGMAAPDSAIFASYALVGRHYLHFTMRFGFHFTTVASLCGDEASSNYIAMHYVGGGGDFAGRLRRLRLLKKILAGLDFSLATTGDVLEARISGLPRPVIEEKLDLLGRLLGATKLLDMVLRDEAMVERYAAEFMAGRYHFG